LGRDKTLSYCDAPQAFDVLERLDPNTQAYEAKRGAAVGVFQMVVAGKEEVCYAVVHYMSPNSNDPK